MLEKKEGIASQSAKLRMLLAVVALTAMLALALTACAPGGSKSDSAGDGGVDWDAIIVENPDDPFVASYSSGDDDHLVTMHQKLGYTCADCHDDADAQLVGTLDEPVESSESNVGTREMCLNEACHPAGTRSRKAPSWTASPPCTTEMPNTTFTTTIACSRLRRVP